jgi:hypothetical protein
MMTTTKAVCPTMDDNAIKHLILEEVTKETAVGGIAASPLINRIIAGFVARKEPLPSEADIRVLLFDLLSAEVLLYSGNVFRVIQAPQPKAAGSIRVGEIICDKNGEAIGQIVSIKTNNGMALVEIAPFAEIEGLPRGVVGEVVGEAPKVSKKHGFVEPNAPISFNFGSDSAWAMFKEDIPLTPSSLKPGESEHDARMRKAAEKLMNDKDKRRQW